MPSPIANSESEVKGENRYNCVGELPLDTQSNESIEKKVESMSDDNDTTAAAEGSDSQNVDPTDAVGQTPPISPTIISSLSNIHIFDLIQPLLPDDSSITNKSSKEDLTAALTELLDSNKLSPKQFWEQSLLNIPYTALQGDLYAAMRLRKVHEQENKRSPKEVVKKKENPKKSKAPVVLPPPAKRPFYTKIEAVQILENYKPVHLVMKQMIDQKLVPCQTTHLYALLKTDKQGGDLNTPWKKEQLPPKKETKKIPEQPLVLPLPSVPPYYMEKEVMELINNMPAATNPPYYTKAQTVNLLLFCAPYERLIMEKLVEQELVPVSLTALRVLFKQAKSGEANLNLDKPWNTKRSNNMEKSVKSKKREGDENRKEPKKKRMKKNLAVDGEMKMPKKSENTSSVSSSSVWQAFMFHAKSLNDAEFVRHVALEFERRGYTFGLKLGTVKSGDSGGDDNMQKEQGARIDSGDKEPSGDGKAMVLETENDKEKGAAAGDGVESETLDQTQTQNDMEKVTINFTGQDSKGTADSDDNEKPRADDAVKKTAPLPALPLGVLFYPSTTQPQITQSKRWDEMYDQLKAFYDEHGHIQVADNALSKWVIRQKNQWKEMQTEGTRHYMTVHRLEKLHAINFGDLILDGDAGADSSTIMTDGQIKREAKKERTWNERLNELKAFVESHGTTVVPRQVNDRLSKWSYKQRVNIKLFRAGDTTVFMNQEKIDKLNEIGFDISGEHADVREDQIRNAKSKSDVIWEENFNALVSYKEKFGTCDVKEKKKGDNDEWKKLASWVSLQRTKYKKKKSGKSVGRTFPVTDEQIKKLAGIGFIFTKRLDFEARFKQLLEFVREHGHTRVPVFYAEHDNLGRWAKRMRDGIRMNEPWVNEIHKARLLGIGFDIEARQVFDHPIKKQPELQEFAQLDFVNQGEP